MDFHLKFNMPGLLFEIQYGLHHSPPASKADMNRIN